MSALCCEIGNQRNAIAILHQLFFLLCIYILLSCCGFFFQFRAHKFQFAMPVSKLILLSICMRPRRSSCWCCCCSSGCCFSCCSCRCVQSVLNFVVNYVVVVFVDALGAHFHKAHCAMAMGVAHTLTHAHTHNTLALALSLLCCRFSMP